MTNSTPDDVALGPRSLLDGVAADVAALLGIKSIKHRVRPIPAVDGQNLARTVYTRIQENYELGGATRNKDRSTQNWRWPSLIASKDITRNSPEVRIERAIAATAMALHSYHWGNQVPVASGLINGARDRRRAIDLVRRHSADHFELIELKIGSDTPLYAAIEVLGYGCLWLLAREDRPERPSALLSASRLDLQVLAPAAFYDGFQLDQLEQALDDGVRQVGGTLGVKMGFHFFVLDPDIASGLLNDGEPLLTALARSRPLHAEQHSS